MEDVDEPKVTMECVWCGKDFQTEAEYEDAVSLACRLCDDCFDIAYRTNQI